MFESAWEQFIQALWSPPHINITEPAGLREILVKTKLFSESQVEDIAKAAEEKVWKDKLLENTRKVLELGAFGAPWFWVRNGEGKEEPFFGSDRYVHDLLGSRECLCD